MARPRPAAIKSPIGGHAVLAALLAIGLCSSLRCPPAAAQDRYRLQADKTWEKLATVDPASPEGRLQAIRKMIAQGQSKQAQKTATTWIEQQPNHTLVPEAYLLRGDAKVLRQDYYKALFDYEHLVRQYHAAPQFHTALERELKIAKLFATGMRRKLWGLRVVGAGDVAEQLFILVQERSPGSPQGEEASIALGDYYFNRAQMSSATKAYDLFLANYPRSEHRERAMVQLIRAHLATFKGPRFDASGLIEAAERLKDYQRHFPEGAEQFEAKALLVRIDESLARKAFYSGRWYESHGEPLSATYLYQRVVRDHGQTSIAKMAMDRLERQQRPPVAPRQPRPPTPPSETDEATKGNATGGLPTTGPATPRKPRTEKMR